MPRFNAYEFEARALKKDAIIRFIYARFFRPTTLKQRARIATVLKSATIAEREWFAHEAQVNPPSDETWRQIVEEVRRG